MSTLQDAVALIKAGDRQGGQRILARILARDPANEAAWLWMSSVVERDEQRRYCLEQVLKYNPGHAVARAGLARLQEPGSEVAAPLLQESRPEVVAPAAETWSAPQAGPEPTAGEGAVGQAPAPSARDAAMAKDMTDFVIAQIAKHETLDNIVLKLCEVSGMSWAEARTFAERVEQESRPQIARRQRPILLLAGAISLLIGGYLAYNSASSLATLFGTMGSPSENLLSYLLSTPELARRLITLAIATAMLVGGLWGTVRALLPPGQQSLLTPAVGGAADRSTDDFVGIHVSLSEEDVASGRRGRNRVGP